MSRHPAVGIATVPLFGPYRTKAGTDRPRPGASGPDSARSGRGAAASPQSKRGESTVTQRGTGPGGPSDDLAPRRSHTAAEGSFRH
jgi:hypothetical protein